MTPSTCRFPHLPCLDNKSVTHSISPSNWHSFVLSRVDVFCEEPSSPLRIVQTFQYVTKFNILRFDSIFWTVHGAHLSHLKCRTIGRIFMWISIDSSMASFTAARRGVFFVVLCSLRDVMSLIFPFARCFKCLAQRAIGEQRLAYSSANCQQITGLSLSWTRPPRDNSKPGQDQRMDRRLPGSTSHHILSWRSDKHFSGRSVRLITRSPMSVQLQPLNLVLWTKLLSDLATPRCASTSQLW
jgi:hypothetical protein